jgi:serine/threonine-protein kinase
MPSPGVVLHGRYRLTQRIAAGDPASASATAAASPGTSPAPGADDPVALCKSDSSSYRVIDTKKLKTSGGVLRGTIYLLYSDKDRSKCVVTIKERTARKTASVEAFLEIKDFLRFWGDEKHPYYAGPISGGGTGKCIKWGGSVDGIDYESAFGHCE